MSLIDKPQKPKKKILLPASRTFYFDYTSKKVSLDYFLGWVKENAPKGAKDITISIDEDIDYETGYTNSCNILVEWKVKMDNVRYDSQMKKYKKQLAKWKEQCKK